MLRSHTAVVALVVFALFNIPFMSLMRGALPHHWRGEGARHHVKLFLRGEIEKYDSWYPMSMAYDHYLLHGADTLYDAVFFGHTAKFQYPPSALLLFGIQERLNPRPEHYVHLPEQFYGAVITDWVPLLVRWTWWGVVAAISATVAILVAGLGEAGRVSGCEATRTDLVISAGAGALLSLYYYPLVKAFSLGQVQPLIAAAFALALLSWWYGQRFLAGFLCGLVCLLKPQFGVLLIWGLLRREWLFGGGILAAVLPGGLASVYTFGWKPHFDYLRILSYITRHGEGFYANESVNGLVNRALGNGMNAVWDGSAFAPYHPVVYTITLLSSLAILALVLYPAGWKRSDRFSSILDLSLAALGATLASPVAWEHHYSIILPIFALCFAAVFARRGAVPIAMLAYLAVSFFLCSHYFEKTILLADTGWNFLQSYRLAGALMAMHIVWRLRRDGTGEHDEGRAD